MCTVSKLLFTKVVFYIMIYLNTVLREPTLTIET